MEDLEDPGASHTEVLMNDGLAESEPPEAFERDDYRVLLVAEKYQTGFDQPLLQTTYVESDWAVCRLYRRCRAQPDGAGLGRARFRQRGRRHLQAN